MLSLKSFLMNIFNFQMQNNRYVENQSNLFGLHKKGLRLFGISLMEDAQETFAYNMYTIIVFSILVTTPVSLFGYALTVDEEHYDIALESITYGVAFVSSFTKVLSFYRVRKDLRQIVNALESSDFGVNIARGGNKEERLLNECAFYIHLQLRVLLTVFFGNVFVAWMGTAISQFNNAEKKSWVLPYGGFPLLDITIPFNFNVVWAYQAVQMAVMGFHTLCVGTLLSGVMQCISYQFKVLQNFIQRVIIYSNLKLKGKENKNIDITNPEHSEWTYLNNAIKEIVDFHSKIISLAEHFKSLINFPVLVDFIGMSLIFCFVTFYIQNFPQINFRLFSLLLLFFGNIFIQFIASYWGNEAMLQSLLVEQACTQVDIVGTDLKFQKSWVFIIQRSQKAVYFTVGKFTPLTLNTFLVIVKTAYSCFMMLYTMSSEKDTK